MSPFKLTAMLNEKVKHEKDTISSSFDRCIYVSNG